MGILRKLGGVLLLLASSAAVLAQSGPYEASVNTTEVEVRSGRSPKFYPTTKLRQGDRVTVIREEEGWLAIKPPPGSFSWINGRFLERSGSYAQVLGTDVPVRIGSSLTNEPPSVEQVKLQRGAQVVILGDPMYATDGKWWPIVPPPQEVRYIPREAVRPGAMVQPFPPATSSASGKSPLAATPGNPPMGFETPRVDSASSVPARMPMGPASPVGHPGNGAALSALAGGGNQPSAVLAGPISNDPAWLQAQQAEQAGNIPEAIRLYTLLANQTRDHDLQMTCYNRAHFLRQGNRGSVPPGYQPGRPAETAFGGNLRPIPVVNSPVQQQVTQYVPPRAQPGVQGAPAGLMAPGQPSGAGRLSRAPFAIDGRPVYVLQNCQGQSWLYVTAQPGLNLDPYLNQIVDLYGSIAVRPDLNGNRLMTAQSVTRLQ